jgi:hypothetical protein
MNRKNNQNNHINHSSDNSRYNEKNLFTLSGYKKDKNFHKIMYGFVK